MRQHWRKLLIGTALALWLVPVAILSTIGGPTGVALTSEPPRESPVERISAGGIHYGRCDGITDAVVLYPEPCGWDRARRQMLASR